MKRVIIIDYKLGNLYSVHHAYKHVGLDVEISGDPREYSLHPAWVLSPSMKNMEKLGLAGCLKSVERKAFIWSMPWITNAFSESDEFDQCKGLG